MKSLNGLQNPNLVSLGAVLPFTSPLFLLLPFHFVSLFTFLVTLSPSCLSTPFSSPILPHPFPSFSFPCFSPLSPLRPISPILLLFSTLLSLSSFPVFNFHRLPLHPRLRLASFLPLLLPLLRVMQFHFVSSSLCPRGFASLCFLFLLLVFVSRLFFFFFF